jgi:hypothetical protein
VTLGRTREALVTIPSIHTSLLRRCPTCTDGQRLLLVPEVHPICTLRDHCDLRVHCGRVAPCSHVVDSILPTRKSGLLRVYAYMSVKSKCSWCLTRVRGET